MPSGAWVMGVVRACHQLDGDEQQWLASVTTRLGRGVGARRGVLSCFFRADSNRIHPHGFVMQGSSPVHKDAFLQNCLHRSVLLGRNQKPRASQDTGLPSHGTLSFAACGVLANSWGLFATDSPSSGCAFVFLDTPMPPRMVQRWDSIAPHVVHGLGLRRPHSVLYPIPANDLIWPRDASAPPAWQQLAIQANRQFGGPPTTDIWQGLLKGQWFLLHHFAYQGRRYVVTRRADPSSAALFALTRREARVISLAMDSRYPDYQRIAHAMQSTEATVTTHLARAMKKLGVHSRAELLAIMRMLSSH